MPSFIYKYKAVLPTLIRILSQRPSAAAANVEFTVENELSSTPLPDEVTGSKPGYSIQTMTNATLLLSYVVSIGKLYYTLTRLVLDEFSDSQKGNIRNILDNQINPASLKADPSTVEFQFQVAIQKTLQNI
jgi:hypothetical protein